MFIQNRIFDYFYAFVVSELLNVCKPDARMFKSALGAAGLNSSDTAKAIMIGNNLARDISDIKGANEMNIASMHYKWSPRYETESVDEIVKKFESETE